MFALDRPDGARRMASAVSFLGVNSAGARKARPGNLPLLSRFGQVTSGGMSQHDTTPSGGYDLAGTCPEALWRNPAGGRTEYGPPGLDACAVIECDPGAAHYTWSYSVACAAVGRQARGRLSSRDKAVQAVVNGSALCDAPARGTRARGWATPAVWRGLPSDAMPQPQPFSVCMTWQLIGHTAVAVSSRTNAKPGPTVACPLDGALDGVLQPVRPRCNPSQRLVRCESKLGFGEHGLLLVYGAEYRYASTFGGAEDGPAQVLRVMGLLTNLILAATMRRSTGRAAPNPQIWRHAHTDCSAWGLARRVSEPPNLEASL